MLEKEMRRRVWWTLYVFDSCAAKSFGLPLLLPESSFIKTQMIRNIQDEVCGPRHVPYPPFQQPEINAIPILPVSRFPSNLFACRSRRANAIYRTHCSSTVSHDGQQHLPQSDCIPNRVAGGDDHVGEPHRHMARNTPIMLHRSQQPPSIPILDIYRRTPTYLREEPADPAPAAIFDGMDGR